MLRPRTPSSLAPAVAAALVRGSAAASPAEVDAVRRSVAESVAAMPDFLRLGVTGVATAADAALLLLGGGDFHRQAPDAQTALAERLARLPLPGMAEFVRLTRGLGLVSLYEAREDSVTAAAGTPTG